MFGTWWLPTNPDKTVAGEVTLSEREVWKLRLHDTLLETGELDSMQSESDHQLPVIEGRNADNQKVSLMNPWYPASVWDSITSPTEWYFHSYAVGNSHVTLDTPIRSLAVRLDTLMGWAADPGISAPKLASFPTTIFDPFTVVVPQGITHTSVVGEHAVTLDLLTERRQETFAITCETIARFNVDDICSIDDVWNKWVLPLQDMLVCLTLGYSPLSRVTAGVSEEDDFVEVHANLQRPRSGEHTPQAWHHMLVTLPKLNQVGVDFDSLIRRWFTIRRDQYFGLCLRLLAGLHRHGNLLSDIQLLQAFRAAEAYTRYRTGQKRLSSKAALEAPINDSGAIGSEVTAACTNFVNFAAQQRGAVAHTSDAFLDDLGRRFIAVSEGICWMLRRIYLVELGVPPDEADRLVRTCERYRVDLDFIRDSTP